MNRTKIEWVRNPDSSPGYTWNPITGCLNSCPYCYARKLANGRLKLKYLANENITQKDEAYDKVEDFYSHRANPFFPRFWPEKLTEPYKGLGAKGIFACDMSDLFGLGIPDDWTQKVMHWIRECDWHRFYLLTKQPQNLIKFSPFPDNCFVGVTATDRVMFNKAAGNLAQIEAKVKYISFEPLLASVDKDIAGASYLSMLFKEGWLDWVIIGAQTKPYKPPEFRWVEEIIEACSKADIPYFLKDNLAPIIPRHTKGDKLKQEMPEGR